MALDRDGPNAAQIAFWDGDGGDRWVLYQETHDAMLAALGELAMDAAAIGPGLRVLDIGCGCGGSTLEIARRVGANGTATGIDISSAMLARARERARTVPRPHVTFEHADAEAHDFAPASFDIAYSRFGAMFFTNPATAFSRIGKALVPGGRLCLLCWRDARENDWAMITIDIARELVQMPPRPGPEDPGPFSFKDPERVRRILTEAGFVDIALEPLDRKLCLGADLDKAAVNVQHIGPLAGVVATAPEGVRATVSARTREILAPRVTGNGVWLASACWIVTARGP